MIDIGVNLTNGQFAKDIEWVIEQAVAQGMQAMLVTGTDLASSYQALDICRRFGSSPDGANSNRLFSTAGVHPHDARHWNTEMAQELRALLLAPEVVAVGETGLDFNRNYSAAEDQIEAFEAQLELAAECGKPLFLHERDAWQTQSEILHRNRREFSNAVVHCFTGDRRALEDYLSMDLYIGITGWVCDERRGVDLAALVQDIPLNRLLVETDAPFLLPRNMHPKPASRRNEPANLRWVIRKLAQCYGKTEQEIEWQTSSNARQLFNLPPAERIAS